MNPYMQLPLVYMPALPTAAEDSCCTLPLVPRSTKTLLTGGRHSGCDDVGEPVGDGVLLPLDVAVPEVLGDGVTLTDEEPVDESDPLGEALLESVIEAVGDTEAVALRLDVAVDERLLVAMAVRVTVGVKL